MMLECGERDDHKPCEERTIFACTTLSSQILHCACQTSEKKLTQDPFARQRLPQTSVVLALAFIFVTPHLDCLGFPYGAQHFVCSSNVFPSQASQSEECEHDEKRNVVNERRTHLHLKLPLSSASRRSPTRRADSRKTTCVDMRENIHCFVLGFKLAMSLSSQPTIKLRQCGHRQMGR